MLKPDDFISTCISRGRTFFTGVPCSLLKPLVNCVINHEEVSYITASSEGEAIGIASGAYLGGSGPIVMCQNSGLGNMINPLTSLNFPFRIPLLLLITLRGDPDLSDAPQHELMGQITGDLLNTLRIPWCYLPDTHEGCEEVFDKAERSMVKTGMSFAFILKKGVISGLKQTSSKKLISENNIQGVVETFNSPLKNRMKRIDAIRLIKESVGVDSALVATTGKTGRELFTLGDSENQFYMIGSMGCCAGIGLGISFAVPEKHVVVLDGDGALLMKMGILATVGHYKPDKILHILLDNESYDSTGGQKTVSPAIDFCRIAVSCGYKWASRIDSEKALLKAVSQAMNIEGPVLIHIKVCKGSLPNLGRPDLEPYDIIKRFKYFLCM